MSAHRCGGGVGMLSAPGAHDWRGWIKSEGQRQCQHVLSQRGGGMAAKEADNGELGNAGGCGVRDLCARTMISA